jgi:hypothetical protein
MGVFEFIAKHTADDAKSKVFWVNKKRKKKQI